MFQSISHTLYLCYFGLREPLVQTQVLPYLREIKKLSGLKVSILTFEPEPELKWTAEDIENEKKKLADEGISWHFLKYHKRPSAPATFYDILCGAYFAWKLARKENVDVFHGRVHIPTLMGWIANKFLRRKPKLLFDIRGFFPEEYIDAGIWKADSAVYKVLKYLEKKLLRDADGFVVLTEKAREILFPGSKDSGTDKLGRPVEVIPCCVDLKRFNLDLEKSRNEMREKLKIKDRFVIVYVGSFGGFYMTKETADFFHAAKKNDPQTFALILTQSDPEMIAPLLHERGFSPEDYFIRKVKPAEIPDYLSTADAALSFIKPSYSKLASSPTKNAEYLACGLPLIVNDKVGDTKEQVEDDRTGVVISEFSDAEFENALTKIAEIRADGSSIQRSKDSAEMRFDLEEVGGASYRRLYSKLLAESKK